MMDNIRTNSAAPVVVVVENSLLRAFTCARSQLHQRQHQQQQAEQVQDVPFPIASGMLWKPRTRTPLPPPPPTTTTTLTRKEEREGKFKGNEFIYLAMFVELFRLNL